MNKLVRQWVKRRRDRRDRRDDYCFTPGSADASFTAKQHYMDEDGLVEKPPILEGEASYTSLANLYHAQGKLSMAESYYQKAIETRREASPRPVVDTDQQPFHAAYNSTDESFHDCESNRSYDGALSDDERAVFGSDDTVDTTILDYEKAIRTDGNDVAAFNNLGNIYQEQGRLDEAAEQYHTAINQGSRDAVLLNNLASVLLQRGRAQDATALCERACQLRPTCPACYNNWANALLACGELEAAVDKYRQATFILGESTPAFLLNNLAEVLKARGDLPGARDTFLMAIAADANDPVAYSNLACIYMELDQFDLALPKLEQCVTLSPNFAVGHHNLGNWHLEQGNTEDAVASYQNAVSLGLRQLDTHLNLGLALEQMGNPVLAVQQYRAALDVEPDCVEAQTYLADALIAAHQIADAVQISTGTLAQSPCILSLCTRGKVAKADMDLLGALRWFQQALELDPSHFTVVCCVADALYDVEEYEMALQFYQRARDLPGGDDCAELQINLGNAHHMCGASHDEEMMECYDCAVELDNDFSPAYTSIGNVLQETDQLNKALEFHERAVELAPLSADAQNSYGATLLKLGYLQRAVAAFRKALLLESGYLPAMSNLSQAMMRLGDHAAAFCLAENALERDPGCMSALMNFIAACPTFGADYRTALEDTAHRLDALERSRRSACALTSIAFALLHIGQYNQASVKLKAALERDPELAAAQNNLGVLLEIQRRGPLAAACFARAASLDTHSVEVPNNFGNLLMTQALFGDAVGEFGKSQQIMQSLDYLRQHQTKYTKDGVAALSRARGIVIGMSGSCAGSTTGTFSQAGSQESLFSSSCANSDCEDDDGSQAKSNHTQSSVSSATSWKHSSTWRPQASSKGRRRRNKSTAVDIESGTTGSARERRVMRLTTAPQRLLLDIV
jgi:tetratricopeptide (TPR) repeat protein